MFKKFKLELVIISYFIFVIVLIFSPWALTYISIASYERLAIFKDKIIWMLGRNYKKIEFKDFIYYYVYFMTTLSASIFSLVVWQATKRSADAAAKSYELTKAIENRELVRENEKVKEAALILYYDLLRGLSDVRKIYISQCINSWTYAPKQMFFESNWIRNVAFLKKQLEEQGEKDKKNYIQEIYQLYGELLTIKDYLKYSKTDNIYSLRLKQVVQDFKNIYFEGEVYESLNYVVDFYECNKVIIEKSNKIFKDIELNSNLKNGQVCSQDEEIYNKYYEMTDPKYWNKVKTKEIDVSIDFSRRCYDILKTLDTITK